jgi:hypothetical protein
MLRFAGRSLLAAAIVSAAMAAMPQTGQAQRQARPETKWCLRGPTGGQACLFHTLEQCRKSAHGTGGTCRRNPRYGR